MHQVVLCLLGVLCGLSMVCPTFSATWITFKLAHFINSDSAEGRGCDSWSLENWTTWLHARNVLDQLERDGGGAQYRLYHKPVDSVILTTPHNLDQAFSTPPPLKHFKGTNVWSRAYLVVYYVQFQNGRRTVHRCRDLFVSGAMENGRLVHFERAYPRVLENYGGNLQPGETLQTPNCRNIEPIEQT